MFCGTCSRADSSLVVYLQALFVERGFLEY